MTIRLRGVIVADCQSDTARKERPAPGPIFLSA